MDNMTNDITAANPALPGFEFVQNPIFSRIGIDADGLTLSENDVDAILISAIQMGEALCWIIGDAINYRATLPGKEDWPHLARITGKDPKYLYRLALTAKKVPIGVRHASLSFSHHQAVSGLPAESQFLWLKRAETDGMTAERLRKSILLGRIAYDDDMVSTADKKEWTPQARISELMRWANKEASNVASWPDDYRQAIKRDLEQIVAFYNAL